MEERQRVFKNCPSEMYLLRLHLRTQGMLRVAVVSEFERMRGKLDIHFRGG